MKKQQFKVGDVITEKDKRWKSGALSVIVSISAREHFPGLRQFKIINLKTGNRFLISQEFADRYLRVVA